MEPRNNISAITVCVEYDDYLAVTLPRNRHYFDKYVVITSPFDNRTFKLATANGCTVHATDAFYQRNAWFNKGAALEEGLDVLGRNGWIWVLDADIVLPPNLQLPSNSDPTCLYVPARHVLRDPTAFSDGLDWTTLPVSTMPGEFAGYSQLFHASALTSKPWYTCNWNHAGGCDSDFEAKFPEDKRKRTPFNVLHLGPEGGVMPDSRVGCNWLGRVSPRIDNGQTLKDADIRRAQIETMVRNRRRYGTTKEKLPC